MSQGSFVSGDPDPNHANTVHVHHTDVSFANPRLPALIYGTPYRSKSLHMQGPGRVPVSVTMFVRQGPRLGVMDDTGDSVFDHLHFSIHDMDAMGGMSVRPTPMDEQSLTDSDTGRCMSSTNIPFP